MRPDNLQDQIEALADSVRTSLDGFGRFIHDEHPRKDYPLGPMGATAATKMNAIMVSWPPETASGALVDHYAIWRANAGTSGAPTTPNFGSATPVAVVPSGRLIRSPFAMVLKWFDLDFSTADHTAGQRFRYWVMSIDNEHRTSEARDCGIVAVP